MDESKRDLARTFLIAGVAAGVMERASAQELAAPRFGRTTMELNSGVVPVDMSYPPGSFCRYGADPTGKADSSDAINAALKSNTQVFDDYPSPSRYRITEPVRFRFSGQILRGQGCGDTGKSAGTTIEYSGPKGGKVLSVSNGTRNLSECAVRDLLIDGANLAGIGIEAYDDAVMGGSWRTRVQDVSVVNVTGGKFPVAVYLGTDSAPNFANDTIISSCYIANCSRGLWGAGSWYQVQSTTFSGCGEAAILGGTGSDSSSSAWTVINCVFSSNKRDFDGFHVSQVSFSGCWFENSQSGIYRAAHAHSVSFTGCYLHTFNTGSLMDFGNAAGFHFLAGNYLPADTKSIKVANVNPTSVGAVLGQPIVLLQSNGAEVPSLLVPSQSAVPASPRSFSAQLDMGQSMALPLGRGTFNISLCVTSVVNPRSRTHASYTAFLFDGDNERILPIAKDDGSEGGQSFSIVCAHNKVVLTNTDGHAAAVVACATGAIV